MKNLKQGIDQHDIYRQIKQQGIGSVDTHQTNSLYAMRSCLAQFDDPLGQLYYGPAKIGKGKYIYKLLRTRSQGGAQARLFVHISYDSDQHYIPAEKRFHRKYADKKLMIPGHREIYDLTNEELVEAFREQSKWSQQQGFSHSLDIYI